jgi:hypothetical protein
MARRRMIDPNIWTSEDVSKLTITERLFLIGLFSNADDYGKGKASPVFLRSTIFPYDDIPATEMVAALENISKVINITIYEVGGSKYYKFINWNKWQRVDHPQDSVIPEPLENDSRVIPETIQSDSGLRENIREDNLKENIKEESTEHKDNPVDNVDKVDNSLSLDTQASELCQLYKKLKPGQSIAAHIPAIKIFIQDYGFDWTKEAMQMSITKKNGFIKDWIEGVLKNWRKEGHTTTDNTQSTLPKKRNSFGNYGGQRKYDIKDLRNKLGLRNGPGG